jgi:hypothetical protein
MSDEAWSLLKTSSIGVEGLVSSSSDGHEFEDEHEDLPYISDEDFPHASDEEDAAERIHFIHL